MVCDGTGTIRDTVECCTKEHKCGIGEGDCDKDEECEGNLICGKNNCKSHFSYDADCCYEPKEVHCKWSEFKLALKCTKTCGEGYEIYKRHKIQEAQHNGTECEGKDVMRKRCNLEPCPGDPDRQ